MNVSLTPELEGIIHNCIKSGRYHSASEVISEALRHLEEREELHQLRLATLRDKLGAGLTSLYRGEDVAGEPVFDELGTSVDVPHVDGR